MPIYSRRKSKVVGNYVPPPPSSWVMINGDWNDFGIWDDASNWNDGV